MFHENNKKLFDSYVCEIIYILLKFFKCAVFIKL